MSYLYSRFDVAQKGPDARDVAHLTAYRMVPAIERGETRNHLSSLFHTPYALFITPIEHN
jgi:hypothetical protein